MIKYSENKTIINGETTVAIGKATCTLTPPSISRDYVNKEDYIVPHWLTVGESDGKGVACPQNDDSYDEIKGKRVATCKAELNAKMKLLNRCVKFQKHLLACFAEVNNDIMSLIDDVERLSEKLKGF